MNIATGALSTLLPKLAELVAGEYKLQKGVKREIEELNQELACMAEALSMVAEVPPDHLDKQVKIWASDVRELSYDIEDQLDTFMLHRKPLSQMRFIGKVTNLIKTIKTNHQIHNAVEDIMDKVKKVAQRRDRYYVANIAAKPDIVPVDPRLEAMYRRATELVGIGGPKNELATRLLEQDCSSSSRQQSNIISIVGFGGLGKTTLANSLLQDLKSKFDCHIFVSVSLNPDIKKIFKNILLQLDENMYSRIDEGWEAKQLIDKTIEFLKNRRCLCVIDDLWEELAWDAIKLPFQNGHLGSKIIITTRNRNVAEYVCGGVYELKPLSDDDSRKLLYQRIFETEDGCPPSFVEVTGKIIKKCGGIPLAIITTASLLASRPMHLEEWEGVNKSIGSGLLGHSLDVNKMRKILSLSYNDLPFHLKTCLLSISKYPEDQLIRKDVLLWSWIAEGFIKQETQGPAGKSLHDIAESYFNDLINRSLIQPAQSHAPSEQDGQVHCCQVHDMVLELINHLSAEEGFVTVLSEDGQQASTLTSAMQKRKIRRLSLHNCSIESYVASSKEGREQLSKVRSVDIFGKVTSIPPLSIFRVLRVLHVDDCSGLNNYHLNDLGKLHLLRFLRLCDLAIGKLPESICELESLETLDIRQLDRRLRQRPRRIVLPRSFAKLRKLVRLIANGVELPDGLTLENMTSLREIVGIYVTKHTATKLGKLGELKVLGLCLPIEDQGDSYLLSLMMGQLRCPPSVNKWIVKCLQSCPSLQIFTLSAPHSHRYPVDIMAHFPSGLRKFTSDGGHFEDAFPKWTKPQLSYLTALHLRLYDVRVLPEHLEQLGDLPSLRFLLMHLGAPSHVQKLGIASGFPCLTYFDIWSSRLFLKFEQGAMPKLQNLRLAFSLRSSFDEDSVFDSGLENLPSLRHVIIQILGSRTKMVDVITKAVNDHHNHPSLDFY